MTKWLKKNKRSVIFISVFAVIGVAALALTRADTGQVVSVEVEDSSLTNAIPSSDSNASGGQYVGFGELTGEIPTKQWIIDNAGPSNTGVLQPSGTITASEDGQVIENVDVSGSILIKANDVTIRNCRVTGYSNVNLIRLYPGYSGATIEHCRVELVSPSPEETGSGVIGGNGGSDMTVRHTEVTGDNADGIKAEHDSLYEYNYIHMTEPPGSSIHLDGIQGSGDSNWTARYNVLEMGAENGGNFSLFAQAWNGSSCRHITNVEFRGNYVYGGNYGISFAGGKEGRCSDPSDPAAYITDVRMIDNIFAVDPDGAFGGSNIGFRYGYYSFNRVNQGEITNTGNILEDGRPITSPQSPI